MAQQSKHYRVILKKMLKLIPQFSEKYIVLDSIEETIDVIRIETSFDMNIHDQLFKMDCFPKMSFLLLKN